MSVDALVRQWKESGGFTGRKLADAVDIVEKMERRECIKFLSFPACIMATGTRGVLVEMVKRRLVDVIITTCGTLDHDLARVWKDYYHGDFNMDDAELFHKGVNRLGNVLVPNESYGVLLGRKLGPIFEEILEGRDSISTWELIDQVGARIEDESSLLHWCHRNRVPMYVPGITDGSFGSQLWMYWQTHRNLKVDLFRDEQDLSDITFVANETGAIIIGGATPSILTGMAVGMGKTWEMVVAAEMVAGGYGLGYMTWEAYMFIAYPRIILGMISLGVCGYVYSAAVRALGVKIMPWRRIF